MPTDAKLAALGLLVDTTAQFIGENAVEAPARIMGGARLNKSSIGAFTYVSAQSLASNARVGRYCSIGRRVEIGQGDHPKDWLTTSPFPYSDIFGLRTALTETFDTLPETVIGNDVWLGGKVSVLSGVTIGDGAIVGFGSVVTKDVPPYAIVVGTPAKVIRYRFDEALIDRLLAYKWWRFDLGTKPVAIEWQNPNAALDALEEMERRGELMVIGDRIRRLVSADQKAPLEGGAR